jgi:hypothetical protein
MAFIRFFYETFIKMFKEGLPHSDVHDDDTMARKRKYYDTINVAPPSGLLRLTISAVHGLPHRYLDLKSVVYVKVWNSSSGNERNLVKCRKCINEDSSSKESCVSALFDDCLCDLDVRQMDSECVYIDICVSTGDVGLRGEDLSDSNAVSSKSMPSASSPAASPTRALSLSTIGRAKLACLDILSNRRAGTVKRIDANAKDDSQIMTVNVVLGHPWKLSGSGGAASPSTGGIAKSKSTVDGSNAVSMVYPVSLMVEFNESP